MAHLRALPLLGLLTVAALGVAGCTAAPAAAPEDTQSPMVDPNPAVDALAVVTDEQVDAAIADLPDAITQGMDAGGSPGIAVGVVYQGELVFAEGYGVRDADTEEPVDADTVFPLASVSKSLAASAVGRAIDEGIVTWETPIADHIEGFTLADPYVGSHVTVGDMFSHRSGLYLHAGDELEEIGYDRDTIIERLRLTPLAPWRAAYAYGNFDLTTAGEAVARASGEDWESLSERLVYDPLGMTSTSSRYADLESRDDRAMGHIKVDGEWIVNPDQRQPDEQSPAGGASSSINDMAIWTNMMLAEGEYEGDTFLEVETILPAMSPQMSTGKPIEWGTEARVGSYGYGFNVGTTAGGLVDVNHSGAFAMGAGTIVKMLPHADLGIIVLSNGAATGMVEGVANRFADIAQFGEQRRDWIEFFMSIFERMLDEDRGALADAEPPADPAPAAALETYAGEYANDYFGAARVEVAGDGLVLSLGPTGEWPLEHWDGDVFVFRPTGENANPGTVSQATFDGGTLVLEYFDRHGLGTFTK